MLAAAVLLDFVDEVVIVERDALPAAPVPRKGLPQARHVHLLWSGGVRAIEAIVPGTTHRLLTAGARRIDLPTDMVAYSPQGWFRRWAPSHHLIACSRDLLDWVVREKVTAEPRITVLEGAELLGLDAAAAQQPRPRQPRPQQPRPQRHSAGRLLAGRHPAGPRITGARLRTADGVERTLEADFVVDASGRGSRAREWLRGLGIGPARERKVDSGLVYASRIFRDPTGTGRFPIVAVQAQPTTGTPGRTGSLLPIEDGRWLVTLAGTRGAHPTDDPAGFIPFARTLRHPVLAELIDGAEPLTDVTLTRSTANRRRYFERITDWPDGFVVVGDAVATYNPVYGHGMSVAAQGILAMRDRLRAHGLRTPGTARRVQRALAVPVGTAWGLAVGQDIFYPGAAEDRPPTLTERTVARYLARLNHTCTGSGRVARAVTDVMTLEKPPTVLARPDVLLAVGLGPMRAQLTGPPLRPDERRAARAGTGPAG
jgi:hypothetical protein